MKNLKVGTSVQVTYTGKNAGKGYAGQVVAAYKWHSTIDNDCYDIETKTGIAHGVPEKIVTPVAKSTLRQAIEQAIRDEARLEDKGGMWETSNLLDALESAREYEFLEQTVTIKPTGIYDENDTLLYSIHTRSLYGD